MGWIVVQSGGQELIPPECELDLEEIQSSAQDVVELVTLNVASTAVIGSRGQSESSSADGSLSVHEQRIHRRAAA